MQNAEESILYSLIFHQILNFFVLIVRIIESLVNSVLPQFLELKIGKSNETSTLFLNLKKQQEIGEHVDEQAIES